MKNLIELVERIIEKQITRAEIIDALVKECRYGIEEFGCVIEKNQDVLNTLDSCNFYRVFRSKKLYMRPALNAAVANALTFDSSIIDEVLKQLTGETK